MLDDNDKINALSCVLAAVLLIIVWTAIAATSGWILMLLWNWLIPSIFGLTEITYWQAVGITALLTFIGGFFGKTKS